MFLFYCATSALEGLAMDSRLLTLGGFVLNLLALPLLMAGVIGQIHAFQAEPAMVRRSSFFVDMRHYFWRFLGINLCYLFFVVLVGVLLKTPGSSPALTDASRKPEVIFYLCCVPLGALLLFWRVAVVADDGRLFRSSWRSARALACAPSAMILGLGWGILNGLDRLIGNYSSKPALLRLAALRAAVFTLAGFWIYSWALAAYQNIKVAQWGEATAGAAWSQPEIKPSLRIGWALTVFSLVPGVNLLALIKGARVMRAGRQISLQPVIACGAGGFSVLICLLALLGSLLPRTGAAAERVLLQAANRFEMSQLAHAISYGIILLLLFTSHEYAHAFAASKLGDDTAKNAGRLTLNPLAHLDILGSIVLPGLLVWRHSEVIFGWAKPVPVDTSKFANPRRDHRIVSFAGPGINLAVSMASFLLLAAFFFVMRLLAPAALSHKLASPFDVVSLVGVAGGPWLLGLITFLKELMYTSLALGFFNLLPVPPLDGGWIFSSVLPERARAIFESLRPYSFLVFVVLVFTHVTDYVLAIPLLMAWGGLSLVCTALGFA
jgi:Zn-dependent protease